MSPSKRTLSAIGTAVAIGVGASTLATAQWTPFHNNPGSMMKSFNDNWSATSKDEIGQLASNEGIYVDMNGFKIAKGAAKG